MRSAISLFTGVGGLDFGFEHGGFDTAVAVEIDPVSCRNLRHNRPWAVLEGDIHGISSTKILRAAGLRTGEADVLIGGPPCQPFSKSGYWANGDALRLDDPRADTLTAYLRVLRDTQPKTFFFENVPGIAFKGKAEGLERVINGVAAINAKAGTDYRLSWGVVNAADYGAPQLRERLVIVGDRAGREFRFPKPTHGPGTDNLHHTAWDALGDLPQLPNEPHLKMSGKWADLLPSIPEGQNYLWHTDRGGGQPLFGWRRRYWNFLLKLAKDRPSWTIQAQPGSATGPFHWDNRKLSARELCRLQTFPDDVELLGGRGDVQRMVGNAVPSVLAETFSREMRRQLFGEHVDRICILEPPYRAPCPAPRGVSPVPVKFLPLKGQHAPHPGNGMGYAAVRRAA